MVKKIGSYIPIIIRHEKESLDEKGFRVYIWIKSFLINGLKDLKKVWIK